LFLSDIRSADSYKQAGGARIAKDYRGTPYILGKKGKRTKRKASPVLLQHD
jgi:hypothetical protein